ncbi:hypothetical protein UlMin_010264 [Ulmus minor]
MEISKLPEECISHILSFTSPKDAVRSKLVSPLFRSAVDSDVVWEKFLPFDYKQIISQSTATLNSMSKKDLYFHLCDHPIIINDGNMSFALEKASGKKCFMVGARGLSIIWGDSPAYWGWNSMSESRFSEVAKLRLVWWLDIWAKIETKILSPQTTYEAYLVFKLTEDMYGFDQRAVNLRVYFESQEIGGEGVAVFLDPSRNMSRERGDGWLENKMGEFFNDNGEDGAVLCNLKEVNNFNPKSGLIVEGIEIRPKVDR